MAGGYQDTVISMDQPLKEQKSVRFTAAMFPDGNKEQKLLQAEYMNHMVYTRNVPVNHAMGILANIYRESSFNPSLTSKSESSYGLLQWNDSDKGEWKRGTMMKKPVNKGREKDADGKEPWETDWMGQLDYAIQEVEEGSNKKFHDMYLSDESITDAYTASDWLVNRNIRPYGVIKKVTEESGIIVVPDKARKAEMKHRRDFIKTYNDFNKVFINPLAGGRTRAY